MTLNSFAIDIPFTASPKACKIPYNACPCYP
jgi:hypothetical protein